MVGKNQTWICVVSEDGRVLINLDHVTCIEELEITINYATNERKMVTRFWYNQIIDGMENYRDIDGTYIAELMDKMGMR